MSDDTDLLQPQPRSQLFTVRLWRESGATGAGALYMQVKHVLSGETRSFSAWQPLIDYMMTTFDSFHHPPDSV